MRLISSLVFTLLVTTFLPAQTTTMETNFGGLFAGLGDLHGQYGGVKLKTEVSKGFYAACGVALGNSAGLAFGEEELKTINNLLLLDEYTENYPLPYNPEDFEVGQRRITPSTNFSNYLFTSLSIGKHFHLNRFLLSIESGVVLEKIRVTYITNFGDSDYQDSTLAEVIPVKTALPLIVSFLHYNWHASLGAKYKLNDRLYLGLFSDVYIDGIRTSTYGLSLQAVIATRKK